MPEFGNFKVSDTESYDSYPRVKELMPYVKGVSVKNLVWDSNGKQAPLDFEKSSPSFWIPDTVDFAASSLVDLKV